jgi:integrase
MNLLRPQNVGYNSAPEPLLSVSKSLPNSIAINYRVGTPAWEYMTTYTRPSLLPPVLLVFLHAVFSHGLRVSELLTATIDRIAANDTILLKGSKRSHPRTAIIHGINAHCATIEAIKLYNPIFDLSYPIIYGWCRRLNIGQLLLSHTNVTRTHLGRHKLADEIRMHSGDEAVSVALGHKNPNNARYYGILTASETTRVECGNYHKSKRRDV